MRVWVFLPNLGRNLPMPGRLQWRKLEKTGNAMTERA